MAIGKRRYTAISRTYGCLWVFADCVTAPKLPSDLWSRGSSGNLMEVRTLSDELEQNSLNDVPRILAIAQDLLLGRVTAERMGAACTLLSEVAQNVTHSGSQGYALMQIYKAGNGRRVHIAVGDTGRGIPDSLHRKYPQVGQSSDYLKKSLESGSPPEISATDWDCIKYSIWFAMEGEH